MNMKKGDISFGVIIMMILGLAVLALLSYFLFHEGGSFSKGIAACESRAGTCVGSTAACSGRVIEGKCPTDKAICCLGGDSFG